MALITPSLFNTDTKPAKTGDTGYVRVAFKGGWVGTDGYTYHHAASITPTFELVSFNNTTKDVEIKVNIKSDFYRKKTNSTTWSTTRWDGWYRFHAVRFCVFLNNKLCMPTNTPARTDVTRLNITGKILRYNSGSYVYTDISPYTDTSTFQNSPYDPCHESAGKYNSKDHNNKYYDLRYGFWPFIGKGTGSSAIGAMTAGANTRMSYTQDTYHKLDKADVELTIKTTVSDPTNFELKLLFVPWYAGTPNGEDLYDSYYLYDHYLATYKPFYSVTAGTVTITDNGNNTCNINGTPGKPGLNNKVKQYNLYYGTSTNPQNDKKSSYTSSLTSTKTVTYNVPAPSGTATSRKVYAQGHTVDSYGGGAMTGITDTSINYYAAPSFASGATPTIGRSKSRFTIKENWRLSYPTAQKHPNSYSGVSGYQISVLKKSAGSSNFVSIPFYNDNTSENANPITTDRKATNSSFVENISSYIYRYYYNRNDNSEMTFYASNPNNGLVPGDQIKFVIRAYSVDGAGTKLLSAPIISEAITVKNAGTVRVRANSTWKESEAVYVRANGAWKEIEAIYVRANGEWKEAE